MALLDKLYQLPVKTLKKILAELFPLVARYHRRRQEACEVFEPFTEQELKRVVAAMKTRRAPGPDGISPEALKIAHEAIPEKILEIFNALLEKQEFPKN
ncbi:hypothetical protein HHI36_016496 [Cryptolaemus montrouzieri]|uniref:Reverse transcriptase n=1 Tax=Cryptolaemus montrouzieri TaxID=559131 RepID=A0ABD2NK63_9CUCU